MYQSLLVSFLVVLFAVFHYSPANTRTMSRQVVTTTTPLEWEEVKDMVDPPSTRSSHGISVIGNRLYVFGGEHVARTPIDSTMYSFDFDKMEDKAWTTCKVVGETVPSPRVAHSQAAVGSTIFIFGGRQGVAMSEAPLNDLYAYDTEAGTWTNLTTPSAGTAPSPRSFHKMVSVGTKLYVFGGCGAKGRLADLYSYDVPTKTWTQLPGHDIGGRGGAGFVAVPSESALYVVGGFAGKEMNDVYRFNLDTQAWEGVHGDGAADNQIRPFSVSCGGVLSDNTIVFFGGEVDPSAKGHEGAGGFSNDCQLFDGTTGKYTGTTGAMTKPMTRGWTAAGVLADGKRLVVFGGLSGDDSNPLRLNDLWVLNAKK